MESWSAALRAARLKPRKGIVAMLAPAKSISGIVHYLLSEVGELLA